MSNEQAISMYVLLTGDIRTYWVALGALIVLIAGWLLSRKAVIGVAQRAALTIGWFAAAGYIGSGLLNRYRLVSALASDVNKLKPELAVLRTVAELGPIYEHYQVIVWVSLAAVSIGAMLLIWSNVALQAVAPAKNDG